MRKLLWLSLLSGLLLLTGVVSAQDRTHTVTRGDTLQDIANLYDVELDAILIRNNIIDPNRIRTGQTLIIPTGIVNMPRSHVVQPGERLRDIALRYNTTVEDLQQLNQIANPNNILRGQVITLPTLGGSTTGITGTTYRVEIGDTLREIAARFGTTWPTLAAYNNIPNANYIEAGMILQIPPAGYTPPQTPVVTPVPQQPPQPAYRTYVVQAGDTLSEIALHYHTTVETIRRYNGITDNRRIYPGDVLLIPFHGTPIVNPLPPRQTYHGVYTVRYGDTLFKIAAAFNVNVYDIAEANGILNLNSIFAGQHLHIPGY